MVTEAEATELGESQFGVDSSPHTLTSIRWSLVHEAGIGDIEEICENRKYDDISVYYDSSCSYTVRSCAQNMAKD